ncbi:hypothetical protein [Serratia fonticola]|uniref:hypothetical protein n=1 Tax=Serratia fonticola TaxID=47917 RepID=UPI0034C5FE08
MEDLKLTQSHVIAHRLIISKILEQFPEDQLKQLKANINKSLLNMEQGREDNQTYLEVKKEVDEIIDLLHT